MVTVTTPVFIFHSISTIFKQKKKLISFNAQYKEKTVFLAVNDSRMLFNRMSKSCSKKLYIRQFDSGYITQYTSLSQKAVHNNADYLPAVTCLGPPKKLVKRGKTGRCVNLFSIHKLLKIVTVSGIT